jgi:hypothetical protein
MFISVEVNQPYGWESISYDKPSPSKSAAHSQIGQLFQLIIISNRKLTIIRVTVTTVSVYFTVMEVFQQTSWHSAYVSSFLRATRALDAPSYLVCAR